MSKVLSGVRQNGFFYHEKTMKKLNRDGSSIIGVGGGLCALVSSAE